MSIVKVLKRPVAVEAARWTGENLADLLDWFGPYAQYTLLSSGDLMIHTLEGTMTASPGCWIIKGIKGEFYPCREDIFADTYEVIDGAP